MRHGVIQILRIGLLLSAVMLMLLIMAASRPPMAEDQFIPPLLDKVQAVGCEVVADKVEQQAYVEVYAKHAGEPGWDYRVVIARRDSPEAAFEDCVKWYKDLRGALIKERNKK